MQGYKDLLKAIKAALGKGAVLESIIFTGSVHHGIYIALVDGDMVNKVAEIMGNQAYNFSHWVNPNDITSKGVFCTGVHIKYAKGSKLL